MLNYRSMVLIVFCLCFSGIIQAIPPHPGTYDPVTLRFYESGRPVRLEHDEPADLKMPAEGLNLYPVLFICGMDQTITFTVEEWSQQIYTIGTHPTGSIRDYYREVSNGRFDMDGEVKGWYYSNYEYSHYTANDGMSGGAAELVAEAVDKAEADGMDWSQYDNDGDGYVDCVNVIHQGRDAASGGVGQIWSHRSGLSGDNARTYDGVIIQGYTISAEKRPPSPGIIEPIGTFCHEFGHGLGLPDLYDIAYTGKSDPITNWCIMSNGCFLGSPVGAVPGHFCGWSKAQLGFVDPVYINTPGDYTINASCNNPFDSVFILPVNGSEKEYFTIENRYYDPTNKFDKLPANWYPGLLIYHTDENMAGSNDGRKDHWMTGVEDAQCQKNASDYCNKDNSDAAFSTDHGHTQFNMTTVPDSGGYYLPSGITIGQISTAGETMSFNVFFYPTLQLSSFAPKFLGNKIYEVTVSMIDIAAGDAFNVVGTLHCESPDIVIDTPQSSFGTIAGNGGTGSNASNPFQFHVTGSGSTIIRFTVTSSADNGYTAPEMSFGIPVNSSRILIVDDDVEGGNPQNIEQYYEESLDQLSLDYDTWEVYTWGSPPSEVLGLYDLVIWEDGAYADTAPKGAVLDEIAKYLDRGGDLFLSSHEFIYAQDAYNKQDYEQAAEDGFIRNYLHITAYEQDEYFYEATGVDGSMFDGLTFSFTDVFSDDPTGATGGAYQWWPDEFVLEPPADVQHAEPVLLAGLHDFPSGFPADAKAREDALPENNALLNNPCAMIYQGEHRVFFMSIPVAGIPGDTAAPLNRQEFMRRVLDWFGLSSDEPGLDIDLNQSVFHAGDSFELTLRTSNPTQSGVSAELFVVLECYGMFFFYPSWSQEIGSKTVTLNPGERRIDTIFNFQWPAGVGSGGQTRFWAALVGTSGLLGNYDFCPMSWE